MDPKPGNGRFRLHSQSAPAIGYSAAFGATLQADAAVARKRIPYPFGIGCIQGDAGAWLSCCCTFTPLIKSHKVSENSARIAGPATNRKNNASLSA